MKKLQFDKLYVIAKFVERIPAAFFGPIYSVFLLESGLSLFQISLINLVYMLALSLIDPATGRLGDRHGHTRVFLIGMMTFGIADLVYGSGKVAVVFVIAELIASIGRALMSEALEARLKNKYGGDDDRIHKAKSDGKLYPQIGVMVFSGFSTILIDKLGDLAYGWYIAGGIGIIGTILLTILLRGELAEEKSVRQSDQNRDTPISYRTAFALIMSNRKLRMIAVLSFVSFMAFQPLNMYWAPYIENKVGGVALLGPLWVIIAISIAFGQYLAKRTPALRIDSTTNLKVVALIGVSVFLSSFSFPVLIIVGFFMLHEVGRGMQQLYLHTFTNRSDNDDVIPDSERAFINSIFGSVGTFGSAVGLLGFGALTEYLSIQQVWGVAGLSLLVTTLLLWRNR